MNRAILLKKSIGTSLLTLAVIAMTLLVTGQASALISFISNDLTFTGTVTSVGPNSLSVDKGGTYPFTVVTNGGTSYDGTYNSIADVEVGANILVSATEDQGMLRALSIEPVSSSTYGYGSGCEVFSGNELWVSAIEDGVLFLSRANITFEVAYDGNTSVMPGNQSVNDLTVGETIAINGSDCNSDGLVADSIVRNTLPPTGNNVSCENYSGFGLTNTQVLLSHDEGGAFTPLAAASVPAGTYDVYGISFDNHADNAWDTLTNESWYVEGFSNGSLAYTSSATDDLPDGVNRNETMIGSNVTLTEDVDQMRFVHNAYVDPTYQSITPECVVFVPTGETAPAMDLVKPPVSEPTGQ